MKPIYLKPDQSVVFVAMKIQPKDNNWYPDRYNNGEWWCFWGKKGTDVENKCHLPEFKPPFLPGEECYVREAWRVGAWNEENYQIAIDYKDGPRKKWLFVEDEELFERLWIESTDDAEKAGIKLNEDDRYEWEPGQSPCRWRSPVTMPQWASRRHVRIVSCEPIQQDGKWKWRVEVRPLPDEGR